jgi:putative sporulation protein YtaF
MHWSAIVGIALANNLDNLGVAIAYGVAGIRLSPLVNLWIAIITFVITAASVASGTLIAHYLPARAADGLSAVVLCGIGIWMVVMARGERKHGSAGKDESRAVSLQRVLEDPLLADRDRSRHIDLREATFLGIALSINNVGGGFGAGLTQLSAGWTALLSAGLSFLFLGLGCSAAHRLAGKRLGPHAQTVAGVLLIVIGLRQIHWF